MRLTSVSLVSLQRPLYPLIILIIYLVYIFLLKLLNLGNLKSQYKAFYLFYYLIYSYYIIHLVSFYQAKPKSNNIYISVTEPVEPLGSTLYLFSQLCSFGSVSDRYTFFYPKAQGNRQDFDQVIFAEHFYTNTFSQPIPYLYSSFLCLLVPQSNSNISTPKVLDYNSIIDLFINLYKDFYF